MSDDSILFTSQQLLEQNEDIVAAIVENLQLGRIEDSIKHYSILHKNLVSLALALDNFPDDDVKPYEEIKKFPDEIMRRDIMDELQHPEQMILPTPPPIPPCAVCAELKYSSFKCRNELGHFEPSSNFTVLESQEFLKVTQFLEYDVRKGGYDRQSNNQVNNNSSQHSNTTTNNNNKNNTTTNTSTSTALTTTNQNKSSGVEVPKPTPSNGEFSNYYSNHYADDGFIRPINGIHPSKRAYRVWTSWERYTICLGIAAYGGIKRDSISSIQALLEGRSCSQLRSYIAKNLTKQDLADYIAGKLPPSPVNYIPPKALLKFNLTSTSTILQQMKSQDTAPLINPPHTLSQLDPRIGKGNWTTLLGLVEGNQPIPNDNKPTSQNLNNNTNNNSSSNEGFIVPNSKYPPLAPYPSTSRAIPILPNPLAPPSSSSDNTQDMSFPSDLQFHQPISIPISIPIPVSESQSQLQPQQLLQTQSSYPGLGSSLVLGDLPVLDPIAAMARGKDSSNALQNQLPSIPSFSSIAKFTHLPPPIMYAPDVLGNNNPPPNKLNSNTKNNPNPLHPSNKNMTRPNIIPSSTTTTSSSILSSLSTSAINRIPYRNSAPAGIPSRIPPSRLPGALAVVNGGVGNTANTAARAVVAAAVAVGTGAGDNELNKKNNPNEVAKKILKKIATAHQKPRKSRPRKPKSTTTSTSTTTTTPTTSISPTTSSIPINEGNLFSTTPFSGYIPLEERIETLDWGYTWGAWGNKPYSINPITGENSNLQILNEESYNECSNPSILRKKSTKKRKSGDLFEESLNTSFQDHLNSSMMSGSKSNHNNNGVNGSEGLISDLNEQSNMELPPFQIPDENSMLMFDEFSMM